MTENIDHFITLEMVEAADARDMEWKTCPVHGTVTDSFHDCGQCQDDSRLLPHT